MFPHEHDHNARAMTVLRGRNIQVVQRGSKIHVTGIRAEEAEDMRARCRASDRLTLIEFALSCIIAFAAVYLGLGTL